MEKTKVLFVAQEIMPYLKESQMGHIGRHLPQGIQEKEKRSGHLCPVTETSMNEETSFMK